MSIGTTYDGNYYPRPFQSFEVTSVDSGGYPTVTKFYAESEQAGQVMFEWHQTNDIVGMVTKFSIENIYTG